MSTAAPFQNRDGFLPYVLIGAPSPGTGFDYVDVTPDKAVLLYWALENLEIVTTCTAAPANINWTVTFGATESFPFTPGGGGGANVTSGAYYTSTTPASAPNGRIKSGTEGTLIIRRARYLGSGSEQKRAEIQFFVRESPTAGMLRVWYKMEIRHFLPPRDCLVRNPSNSLSMSGTPPSSGTFNVLGITLSWDGGGAITSTSTWSTETATVSATSSAFTF